MASVHQGKTEHSPLKVVVSAPGKVILHGEHSVVYGHMAIAASLNLRSYITLEETNETSSSSVHLKMPNIDLDQVFTVSSITNNLLNLNETGDWDCSEPKKVDFEQVLENVHKFLDSQASLKNISISQAQALTTCFFLLSGILHKPGKDNSIGLKSFTLRSSSELPVGAGAGSSASFCVCLATVFLSLAHASKDPKELFLLDDQAKEAISDWAYLGERIMHGNPSGLDNSICTYGSVIAFRRPNTMQRVALSGILKVLLVDTKVSRNTKSLVESVAALRGRHTQVVDNILETMNNVCAEALSLMQKLNNTHDSTEDAVFIRLQELWTINQFLLESLGVSHLSIERIIKLSKEQDLSAKLTGAGGGGFVLVLLPPKKITDTLKAALESEGFSVREVELGGPGVELCY